MSDMPYGLTDNDIDAFVGVIADNTKVKEIILFGSRAKGNYSQASDIDLALVGDDLRITDITNSLLDLDNLYLPFKFDVIIYNRINEPALREHIINCGVKLYTRE